MADNPKSDLSDYPRPWFYRPEIYYGFIIFPPVWSVLRLRSPWHNREGGTWNILVGGLAWFFIIASVVLSVRWVQEGGVINLFFFVPGLLLTLLTQVQWTAHRARHGPPPTASEDVPAAATPTPAPSPETAAAKLADAEGGGEPADDGGGITGRSGFASRRRRRRRRRSVSRSADSATLC